MPDIIRNLIPVIAVVLVFLLIKKLTQVSAGEAMRLLSQGAIVIDVRSPSEFQGGHVQGARNIPLPDLAAGIAKVAHDKSKPILVHCLSGTRSAMAKRVLRQMGYTSVHNLGSLARARATVGSATR